MLIKDLLPTPTEVAHSFLSNIGNKELLCDWRPGSESWHEHSDCEKNPQGECRKLVATIQEKNDKYCSLTVPNSSEVSTSTVMSGSSAPLCVYYRKKFHKKSPANCANQRTENNNLCDGCDSAISSELHSGTRKRQVISVESETHPIRSPFALPTECSVEGLVSKSGSYNGCFDIEPCSEEGLRTEAVRVLDRCYIDDTCSSSKLNLDLISASVKTHDDDTGECSSIASFFEGLSENMSEKDVCIYILRSQGLLGTAAPLRDQVRSDDNAMDIGHNDCTRTCRACGLAETAFKMLICDHCEDAFHVSCCNPRIKRIPLDVWFCYSCLKRKHKIMNENSSSSPPTISTDSTRGRNATNKGEMAPIELMLRDIEPSKSNVRVGREYQVEIPDWSSPLVDEMDLTRDPEEIRKLEYLSEPVQKSNRTPRLSSIGNWLQCREVTEGIGEGNDEKICGKWRRAPLFEVQNDDWECFDAVLWDSAHADCAVPQELPTYEVLKQLKYVEMLRPLLAAKKRKQENT